MKLFFISAIMLLITLAGASALVLNVSASNHVNSGSPDTVYNSPIPLYAQGNANTYRIYFNISNLTGYYPENLSFKVNGKSGTSTTINISMYYCNDTYNSTTLTWNNKATEVTNCDEKPFFATRQIDYVNGMRYNATLNSTLYYSNSAPFSVMFKFETEGTDSSWISVPSKADATMTNRPWVEYEVAPAAAEPTASFVYPTPPNSSHNNTQIVINVSCDLAVGKYLWFDNVSGTTLVIDNATDGSYTTTATAEGAYYYRGGCWDEVTQSSGGNTTGRVWYYDVTYPTINPNVDNFFDLNNRSNVNQYNSSVWINITFRDDIELYGALINVTKAGVSLFNFTNESMDGQTSYNYTHVLNVTNWTVGTYQIEVVASDSHTRHNISNYSNGRRGDGTLWFNTTEGNLVEFQMNAAWAVQVERRDDRYSFGVNFGVRGDKTLYLHTEKPLIRRAQSGYVGHFVIPGATIKDGGNWVDFENNRGWTPQITMINETLYEITFHDVQGVVFFESIGGLNVYQANFTWYRGNYSTTSHTALINTNTTLWINLTTDVTIVNTTASLWYNNSMKATNKTTGSGWTAFNSTWDVGDSNGTFYYFWDVNITQDGLGANYSFNTTNTSHSVINWSVTNCTSGNMTINISFFDENNPASSMEATLQAIFITYPDGINNSFNHTYAVNLTNVSASRWYTFCISPADAQLRAWVYFLYNNSGGFYHRYYLINELLNATMQSIYVYDATSTAGFSNLSMTARNALNYQYLSGTYAKMQRLYVGEGVYRTVQMDLSGDYGLMLFNILEQTTDYRFIFLNQWGEVLRTTDAMKFRCIAASCDLTMLIDPTVATAATTGLAVALSYDSTTDVISLVWSDPEGDNRNVRFNVMGSINGVAYAICNTTTTGASGVDTCNVAAASGLVTARIYAEDVQVYSEYFDVGAGKIGALISAKEGSFWSLAIYTTTVGFGLFSPVAAIICACIGLILIYELGIFTPLSMMVLVACVVIAIILGIKLRT